MVREGGLEPPIYRFKAGRVNQLRYSRIYHWHGAKGSNLQSPGSEPGMLPITPAPYFWCPQMDSNHQLTGYGPVTLTIELWEHFGVTDETWTRKDRGHSPARIPFPPQPPRYYLISGGRSSRDCYLAPRAGLDPATLRLTAGRYHQTELSGNNGASDRDRTCDPSIIGRMLYQNWATEALMVSLRGLEPPTYRLKAGYSGHWVTETYWCSRMDLNHQPRG